MQRRSDEKQHRRPPLPPGITLMSDMTMNSSDMKLSA
jgi:hypothetical protein